MTPKKIAIIAIIVAALGVTGILAFSKKGPSVAGSMPNAPAQKQLIIPKEYQAPLLQIEDSFTAINDGIKALPQDVVQKFVAFQNQAKELDRQRRELLTNALWDLKIERQAAPFRAYGVLPIQGQKTALFNWQDPAVSAKPTDAPKPEAKPEVK